MKRFNYVCSLLVIFFGSASLFISGLSHRHRLRKQARSLGRAFTLLTCIAGLANSLSMLCGVCCGEECCVDGCCEGMDNDAV